MLDAFLATVRPALEAAGDLEEVITLLDTVRRGGTGADRQRAAFTRRESFDDVLDLLVRDTEAGA